MNPVLTRLLKARKQLQFAENQLYEASCLLINNPSQGSVAQVEITRRAQRATDLLTELERNILNGLELLLSYDQRPNPEGAGADRDD